MIAQRKAGTAPKLLTVEVSDPIGQQSVVLEGVSPKATARQIVAMALSELRLPADVVWDLRDEATSRLLSDEQKAGDLARDTIPHVQVTLQPNAGLG